MFVPVWLIATVIYVLFLAVVIFKSDKPEFVHRSVLPFVILFRCSVITILYLIFWIAYLAI